MCFPYFFLFSLSWLAPLSSLFIIVSPRPVHRRRPPPRGARLARSEQVAALLSLLYYDDYVIILFRPELPKKSIKMCNRRRRRCCWWRQFNFAPAATIRFGGCRGSVAAILRDVGETLSWAGRAGHPAIMRRRRLSARINVAAARPSGLLDARVPTPSAARRVHVRVQTAVAAPHSYIVDGGSSACAKRTLSSWPAAPLESHPPKIEFRMCTQRAHTHLLRRSNWTRFGISGFSVSRRMQARGKLTIFFKLS